MSCPLVNKLKHLLLDRIYYRSAAHEEKGRSDCVWLQITQLRTARKALRATRVPASNKANE